jgi:hypothetical protein
MGPAYPHISVISPSNFAAVPVSQHPNGFFCPAINGKSRAEKAMEQAENTCTCSICGVVEQKTNKGNLPRWWVRETAGGGGGEARLLCADCAAGVPLNDRQAQKQYVSHIPLFTPVSSDFKKRR